MVIRTTALPATPGPTIFLEDIPVTKFQNQQNLFRLERYTYECNLSINRG